MIGQKYGLETANLVGPDGTYLPGTYPTLDGVNVFKANDIVIELLKEKARYCMSKNAAQLSVLLASQNADHFPRDPAVVRQHG